MQGTQYDVNCFFFQAEDGIRDVAVTGVQTCALPISGLGAAESGRGRSASGRRMTGTSAFQSGGRDMRSEERRVGKECRSRGSPYHYKKKQGRTVRGPAWGGDRR